MINKSAQKKKSAFNIVDIIVVALLVIGLTYFIVSHVIGYDLRTIGAKEITVEYTVRVENVRKSYLDYIKLEDTVKSEDGEILMGKIIDISTATDDGITYTVDITIRSDAYMRKNSSISIQNLKLKPDSAIALRFPDYAPPSAVITNIKVV